MDFKKVKSGDKLNIPAKTYNAFIDAAQANKARNNFLSASNKNSDSRKVLVQNNSGGNLDKFSVLGIDSPYITPTENETDFQERITIVGVTPTEDDHTGKFIVLQEPIPNGKTGRGILSGETIVKIDVEDADHEYAEVTDSQAGYLTSTDSGSAKILWKESGTGQVWAYVRLGFPQIYNIYEDDASSVYTIDRTNESDDSKEWNPSDNLPATWEDHDCVKLIVEYLRYDTTAGTLKRVKQEYHWAASNAPVIPAATVTTAETSDCDGS
jgi:hypothetical protein